MAVFGEEGQEDVRECSNCGATEDLLKCSRCHIAWFCSVKCQKAYWPFHKVDCHRNEFADAVENTEPKFARWMRGHRKLAVLKDDEVDRLERASAAVTGLSRQDVMESMYNRLEPKPEAPSYSAEDRIAMRAAAEAAELQARQADAHARAWEELAVPEGLGLDCGQYKWQQSQTHVDVVARVLPNVDLRQVSVQLSTGRLEVRVGERAPLQGDLYAEIKAEESTWYMLDGLLHLSLLKRCRRGRYGAGRTNADTFWKAVLRKGPACERLQMEHPPLAYYQLPFEEEEPNQAPKKLRSARGGSSAGRLTM